MTLIEVIHGEPRLWRCTAWYKINTSRAKNNWADRPRFSLPYLAKELKPKWNCRWWVWHQIYENSKSVFDVHYLLSSSTNKPWIWYFFSVTLKLSLNQRTTLYFQLFCSQLSLLEFNFASEIFIKGKYDYRLPELGFVIVRSCFVPSWLSIQGDEMKVRELLVLLLARMITMLHQLVEEKLRFLPRDMTKMVEMPPCTVLPPTFALYSCTKQLRTTYYRFTGLTIVQKPLAWAESKVRNCGIYMLGIHMKRNPDEEIRLLRM